MENYIPKANSNKEILSIELNKLNILSSINENNEYKEDGIKIKKLKDNSLTNFICEINRNKIKYIGSLNKNFEKEGYGFLTYENGEKYLGIFKENLRDNHGYYEYNPEISKDKKNIIYQFYFGIWKKNIKNEKGVYLWLNENINAIPFNNFDNANFDVFIGLFELDNLKYGTYLSKKQNDYYVYHGFFDKNGKKFGDNVFFYNSTEDQLICGKVINDKFINGYICLYNEDGILSSILYCEFDNNGSIISYKNNIDKNKYENVINDMQMFRNIIMQEDYFTDTFNIFKEMKYFCDNNIKFDSFYDDSLDLIDMTFKFNNAKIFNEIEKNLDLFNRKN